MPQLNPAPWFLMLIFSWLTFIMIIPPKVLTHTSPNETSPQNMKLKTEPWTWPWY